MHTLLSLCIQEVDDDDDDDDDNEILTSGVVLEGARGGGLKNYMPVGEILKEICVLMLRKIPSVLLYNPPVRESSPPPHRANPDATFG